MTQPESKYRVERLEEVPLPDPTGRISWSTRVYYSLPNGYMGSVVVPGRQVAAEAVREALDADVARVMQIFGA